MVCVARPEKMETDSPAWTVLAEGGIEGLPHSGPLDGGDSVYERSERERPYIRIPGLIAAGVEISLALKKFYIKYIIHNREMDGAGEGAGK